jgi:hypothetical protein
VEWLIDIVGLGIQTLEVELENGRVHPSSAESLPPKAHALLTILSPVAAGPAETEGPSLADLMADSAGIGKGEYTDLSYNKAHMNDFGR